MDKKNTRQKEQRHRTKNIEAGYSPLEVKLVKIHVYLPKMGNINCGRKKEEGGEERYGSGINHCLFQMGSIQCQMY